MADFNKPTVDSEYTQFPTEIRAAISAALSFLDGEHTNVPLKAKRWNPLAKIFEEYNGTQWVPMATEYKLPVDYDSLKNKPTPNSAVDDESDTKFASSAAVKTAYDKGVEAKTAADNAQSTANSKQSPATTLAGYGIGNFKIENFVGDVNSLQTDGIYAVTQASRSQNLPVAGNGCHIQVIAGGDGRWCRQIAYIVYSTDVYERHQTNYQTDSWSGWARIDVRDEFNALKDIFIGIPIPYPLSTIPTGCLAMNGQRFDTRRYPKLAQKYPSGKLPDLRGEFIRGWDNGRNVDAGRALLSEQGDAIRNITAYARMFTAEGDNSSSGAIKVSDFKTSGRAAGGGGRGLQFDFDASRVVPTANEVRPRNIAFHYICLAA